MESQDERNFEIIHLADMTEATAKPRKKGRPRGPSGKQRLEARVTFRCTPQEKIWLETQAKTSKLSLGDWLRHNLTRNNP